VYVTRPQASGLLLVQHVMPVSCGVPDRDRQGMNEFLRFISIFYPEKYTSKESN
jgi:hypothetical protein